MSEFVYFISREGSEDGPVKIGMTTKSVKSRLTMLQTGTPFKLKCLDHIEVDDGCAAYFERAFHKMLSSKRLNGEWFDITPSDVEALPKNLEALEKLASLEGKTFPGRKQSLTLRLDRAVIEYFRSTGEGWQTRMNEALRNAAGL